jgi:sugar phosphate isomerase/epimerase
VYQSRSDGCSDRNRRAFLRMTGTLAASGQSLLQAATPTIPPIGILLGTTIRTGTLEERLDAAKAAGVACVQMSMDCAGLPQMPDHIPADLPGRMRREAAARGIQIASVTGTFNMTHPDPEQRKLGLRRLKVLAGVCPEIGTSAIHICTGTRNPASMWSPHPDNGSPEAWRDMAACVREAAEIARQAKAVLAFEPEMSNVVDSAGKARRLLDEIGSPHLKVTIDPANLFHRGELPRMKEILEEAFALLGKDIVLAHAKDLDRDGEAGHRVAGQGVLDYDLYLRLLLVNNYTGPILLHSLTGEQVAGCVTFLKAKLASAQRSLA